MSVVDEFRTRRPVAQSGGTSLWSILGTAAAFLLGGAFVLGYGSVSREWPNVVAYVGEWFKPTPSVVASASVRLGNASTAPLLRTCLAAELDALNAPGMDVGAFYKMMRADNWILRLPVSVASLDRNSGPEAYLFGKIAECALSRPASLCDPDNRAVAVEAVGDFMTHVARFEAQSAKLPLMERFERERSAKLEPGLKGRILGRLADRVREGRLAASDFGYLSDPEVKTVVRGMSPAPDPCGARGS
jgi:hypothetical protein